MSEVKDQDETSGFEVESEDFPETESSTQEEASEEQASSEVAESEAEGDSKNESTDEDKADDSLADDTSANEVEHKKPNGVQKRIDKVVREREDVKRENERLKKQLKESEGNASDQSKEPVEADFETYDQYLDALDKYDSPTETKEPAEESENDKHKDTSNELTDNQKSSMAVIRESIDSDESKPEDFEAVALDPNVPITGEMLEALAECDNITAVMMQLGNDHDMALSIANKSPAQQMRAIAKLDLGIKVIPPKPVQKSLAADPISPVKGSEQHEKSDSEMSFSEFEAKDRARNSARKSTW